MFSEKFFKGWFIFVAIFGVIAFSFSAYLAYLVVKSIVKYLGA